MVFLSQFCLFVMVFSSLVRQSGAFVALQGVMKRAGRPNGMVVSSYDLIDQERRFASYSSSSASMILDPLVICGPSGVGKGTLIARFQDDFPGLP